MTYGHFLCFAIELSDGHYWASEAGLIIEKPLRFVGDENNPSNVVVEISGSIKWTSKSGWMEGITWRRPKISSSEVASPILDVDGAGRLDIRNCVFDNGSLPGSVVQLAGNGAKGIWSGAHFKNGGSYGIEMEGNAHLSMKKVCPNGGSCLPCSQTETLLSLSV